MKKYFILFISLCLIFTHKAFGQEVIKSLEELNKFYSPAESCSPCHKQPYEEWKTSYHAQAMTTIITGFTKYIKEVEAKKGKFPDKRDLMACFECHAPTLRLASEELVQQVAKLVVEGKKEELKKFNVDCSFCHTTNITGKLPEEGVYYGSIEDAIKPVGTHGSKYAEITTKAESCEGCHKSFYEPLAIYCSLAYEYWKKGPISQEKECQYCHMKSRDGLASDSEGSPMRVIHSHDFPGDHSPAALKDAVRLSMDTNVSDQKVTMTVNIRNLTGHGIPDG